MTSTATHRSQKVRRLQNVVGMLCAGVGLAAVWAFFIPQTDPATLDNTDTIAILKANFLFQFADKNEWPDEVKTGPFRLGVIGNDRLVEELVDKYAMKPVRQQMLEVVDLDPDAFVDGQPPVFCHVIYLEPGHGDLEALSQSLSNSPTMLVGHEPKGTAKGALINFVAQANAVRYAVNAQEAKRRNLLIGNRIMSWAVADQ